MSEVIEDPGDPSQFIIQHAAVGEFGRQVNDVVIGHVHDAARCAGEYCVMHNPSPHHMSDWRMNWRDDKGMMERLCPHGVGHPDPDDAAFHVRAGRGALLTHGCDGCCRRDEQP